MEENGCFLDQQTTRTSDGTFDSPGSGGFQNRLIYETILKGTVHEKTKIAQ